MNREWRIVSDDGQETITFTSFVSGNFKRDGSVVSDSIEEGSFATYNKTTSALEAPITLGFEGTTAEISDIIDTLDKLKTEPIIFNLITPHKEYANLTLEKYDYIIRHYNALFVNLTIKEINEVEPEYRKIDIPASETKNVGNASTQDGGTVGTQQQAEGSTEQKQKSRSILSRL